MTQSTVTSSPVGSGSSTSQRQYVIQQKRFPKAFLSKSKASSFMGCPARFRRRKSEPEVQWDEDDSDPDLGARGNFLHRVLEIEACTRSQEGRLDAAVSPDELLETLKVAAQNMAPDPLPTPETLTWAVEAIQATGRTWDFSNVWQVELPFTFKLPGGLTFGGIFDVVKKHEDGSIEVCDWKTGQVPPTRKQASQDVQANAYLYAAKQLWPDAPRIFFTFDYVLVEERVWVEPDQQQELVTLAWLDAVATTLQAMNLAEQDLIKRSQAVGHALVDPTVWPEKVGRHCGECGFRTDCESYQRWVKAHGSTPLPPLANLTPEQVAAEAIRSRTLAEVHDARRKDAYAILDAAMGQQKRCSFHGHDFTRKGRPSYGEVPVDEALQLAVDAGVPLPLAAQCVSEHKERFFDLEKLDKIAANTQFPKGFGKKLTKSILGLRPVQGTSYNLECREVEGQY